MNLKKMTRVCAAACVLILLSQGDAAAQAPMLTVTASGKSVTIQWTDMPGALGYNLQVGTQEGAANVGSINLPAFITRIVVSAPDGTYFLRVRMLALNFQGPFSNEASVTVPTGAPSPAPCPAPGPLTATTNVTGGGVTVNWTPASDAGIYRVEFSRFSGQTELVQNVPGSQLSLTQHIGVIGTFYVRVVAVNSCGTSTSPEISFTIAGATPGSGPRTPDPPPGTLLPLPSYGASVVQQVASTYRGDLINSCREHGGNNLYLFRVLAALRQRDSRWGLNDKRGWAGDLSQDIITYNPTNRPENGESQVYLVDVISSHCGSPDWNWQDVTGVTWAAAGSPACGSPYCARWTIDAYLRAGFPADGRQ